jgi:uncharacterized protein YjbI with pentapeptide repeats
VANDRQLEILKQGVPAWNEWRKENSQIRPDLTDADLTGMDLSKADLSSVNFTKALLRRAILTGAYLTEARLDGADLEDADLKSANLRGTYIQKANLRGAQLWNANLWEAVLDDSDLQGANLIDTNLREANLCRTNLSEARLIGAGLLDANLAGADLRGALLCRTHLAGADLSDAKCQNANFERAVLIDACLDRADLTGASIYGISVWDVSLEGAMQHNLVVHHTRSENAYWNAGRPQPAESVITVDDIEVAQFIYLLLNNQRLRNAIDTITSKVVLILGRFTPERKAVLDALREDIRNRNYLPVVFDFDPSEHQTRMETVSTLAHMARFVIADITDAKTVLEELQGIVPDRPSLPVQPILLSGQKEPGCSTSSIAIPGSCRRCITTAPTCCSRI